MILSEDKFVQVLSSIEDPELHIDIYTLGLVYEKKLEENRVWIKMTFTSPFCPFGPEIVDQIKEGFEKEGIKTVDVEVTFDPPWQPSDELREMLGM